jgi:hypothetical protein
MGLGLFVFVFGTPTAFFFKKKTFEFVDTAWLRRRPV